MFDDNKLFDLFKLIDENNLDYTKIIPANEMKKMSPVVVMRWLSGCSNKEQIIGLNHFTNPIVFKLYKHPDLLFKTMMISSTGPKRYKWINKKTKTYKFPLSVEVISKNFDCNLREANDILPRLSSERIREFAVGHGYDTDFIDKLNKELKKHEHI